MKRNATLPPVYNNQGRTVTAKPYNRMNVYHTEMLMMLTGLLKQKDAPVLQAGIIDINEASGLLKITKPTF